MNSGKICVSVCAESVDNFIRNIGLAEVYADVIELRLDCLDRADLRHTIENLPAIEKTYLFTLRSQGQGGKCDLNLGEKLKFWEHVLWARDGTDLMIDIEADTKMLLAVDPEKVTRIISLHHFEPPPDDLAITWSVLSDLSGGIVKIAAMADDAVDAIAVWKLLETARAEGRPVIPIAMGEAGKWTRILGPAHGAFMTYASPDEGSETAPGQVTAQEMAKVYRVKHLDLETKVYGVIGDPVSRSLSPYIHNPAFASIGANAVFIPFLVKDIDAFMERMVRPETREVELNLAGFAVTMPHKRSVMKYLDVIDATAQAIGAVNTVRIEDGRLTGYNTDAGGFIEPLRQRLSTFAEIRVAVIGAGGAARAVAYALNAGGADVTVVARDPRKGRTIAQEFGTRYSDISSFKSEISNRSCKAYDIIVNATSLGMPGTSEEESLFTAEELSGVRYVYDLVTRVDETPLLREAGQAGIAVIGGLEMLMAQAAKQFEIWTGRHAPIGLMRSSATARMEG